MRFRFISTLFLVLCCFSAVLAQKTGKQKNTNNTVVAPPDTIEVFGIIRDAETKEPLSFVDVFLVGTVNVGTISDESGFYSLKLTTQKGDSIGFAYLGYETKKFKIRSSPKQEINLVLSTEEKTLQMAVVTAKRKKKIPKDTLAFDLWKNVVKNKPLNQISTANNYRFEDYTKIQFNIAKVGEKVSRNKFLNKHIGVMMNGLRRNAAGDKYLPGLLKETLSEYYYRKNPKAFKQIILADRFSGFPNESISAFISEQLKEVDPYEDLIVIFGKSIIGPFAKGSNAFYRYFLSDTLVIDSTERRYKLDFVARRPGDITFLGSAWIDSASYAITQIEMEIPNNAGINFVKAFKTKQSYEKVDGRWVPTVNKNSAEVHIPERLTLFRLSYDRTGSRRNYKFDTEIPDSVFSTDKILRVDSCYQRTDEQWAAYRHDTLNSIEAHIYPMVDSAIRTPLYKNIERFGYFATSGMVRVGPIEFGRVFELVSWNTIEGVRLKLGLNTNQRFSKRFQIAGYCAYGITDKEFKYGLTLTAHLNKPERHWRNLSLQYKYDFIMLGQVNKMMSHDNITAVVSRRTPFNKLMKIRDMGLFYTHDWANGFYNILSFRRRTFFSVDSVFEFTTGPQYDPLPEFTTTEFQLLTHWGIKEKFFTSANGFTRSTLGTKFPILELDYTVGIKGFLGGSYNYHKLLFTLKQRLSSPIGYTNYRLTVGKIFGDAPYPLLTIHLGNQSWFNNKHAFNLMNEFEFVSDTYASLMLDHHFDGLLFNTIPGFRRLGWREVIIAKVLWGQLSPHNRMIINMPESISQPNWYAEVGFGIENIFSIFRVDFLWRLTQRDLPTTRGFGVKLSIEPKF